MCYISRRGGSPLVNHSHYKTIKRAILAATVVLHTWAMCPCLFFLSFFFVPLFFSFARKITIAESHDRIPVISLVRDALPYQPSDSRSSSYKGRSVGPNGKKLPHNCLSCSLSLVYVQILLGIFSFSFFFFGRFFLFSAFSFTTVWLILHLCTGGLYQRR